MNAFRGVSAALALLTLGLGVVMLVWTAFEGGGVGILIGVLFLLAGGGRLYLLRRSGG